MPATRTCKLVVTTAGGQPKLTIDHWRVRTTQIYMAESVATNFMFETFKFDLNRCSALTGLSVPGMSLARDHWKARTTQICMVERVATNIMFECLKLYIRNSTVLLVVDSEAVEGVLSSQLSSCNLPNRSTF